MARLAALFFIVFCIIQITLSANPRVVRDAPADPAPATGGSDLMDQIKGFLQKENIDNALSKLTEAGGKISEVAGQLFNQTYSKAKDAINDLTTKN